MNLPEKEELGTDMAGLSEKNNVCGLKKMTHRALMTVFVRLLLSASISKLLIFLRET